MHSPPPPAPCSAAATTPGSAQQTTAGSKPNVVILLVDDYGWADAGANWPATRETAHIDALAASGVRFTDMHAMSVCTPSRAALLTGRLGLRTGVVVNFNTDAEAGLPRTEVTLASMLKDSAGYDTKIIGKWHLGHAPGFHPTYRGFDEYLGLPYSVDMGCVNVPAANIPPQAPCPTTGPTPLPDTGRPALPLYNSTGPACSGHASCNADIVEQPVNITSLASRYAAAAREFILRHAVTPGSATPAAPFFLYVPFSHVHVPLAHDPKWTNTSARKTLFGDTLMELDDTVGSIIQALADAGVERNTLVLMTGDNGEQEDGGHGGVEEVGVRVARGSASACAQRRLQGPCAHASVEETLAGAVTPRPRWHGGCCRGGLAAPTLAWRRPSLGRSRRACTHVDTPAGAVTPRPRRSH